ncbi:MAG: hypothetical protein V2A79_13225 [Planctomycetota bacterium]
MDRAITRRQWLREAAVSVTAASLLGGGCGSVTEGVPLPNEATEPPGDDYVLVARLAHICDAHIIDEESPARLPFAKGFTPAAWRGYERYSAQLLDGIIRAINRYHEQKDPIHFVVHAGDAVDNRQSNELRWFLEVLDGTGVNPSSGPDDRAPDRRGPAHLDAYIPFQARGLYRQDVHGDKPSIPWYALAGNHDTFALGTFPIVPSLFGCLHTPLPLPNRIGLFLPTALDPASGLAYSPISPAHPGLPLAPSFPTQITPNPERRYFTRQEFVAAHFETVTDPAGHGFEDAGSEKTWYSVSPLPGLRLVALDSCRPALAFPAGRYSEGSIDAEQMAFLNRELGAAQDRGELVIVLTHHTSAVLKWSYGSAVTAEEFRATLNKYPCVVAHLVGHRHRHRVWSHEGYIEFETASTLDYPQEGRIIEIWKSPGDIQLRYWVFSHLPEAAELEQGGPSDLADDPLLEMRLIAFELAAEDPVVPGLVPAEEVIEDIVGPIRDALTGITGEIADLGPEITDLGTGITTLGGQITDTASDVADELLKADAAVRVRAAMAGSLNDRTGVIHLPRK